MARGKGVICQKKKYHIRYTGSQYNLGTNFAAAIKKYTLEKLKCKGIFTGPVKSYCRSFFFFAPGISALFRILLFFNRNRAIFFHINFNLFKTFFCFVRLAG
jgi:hypothetical protein